MKLFSILLLITLVCIACEPSSTNPPSIDTKYGFIVKGGTTNIDRSFYDLLSPLKSQTLSEDKRLSILKKTFLDYTGVELATSATATTAVNLYVSFHDDNKPLGGTLSFRGPKSPYADTIEHPKDAIWQVYYPLPSQGDGKYEVSALLENDGTIRQSTLIETTELLPATFFSTGATNEYVGAKWEAIENAKSYVSIVYDFQAEKSIWAGITKENHLLIDSLDLDPSKTYDMTIFALSWDATLALDEPYAGSLPETFDVSISSRKLAFGTPELSLTTDEVTLSENTNQKTNASIDLRNPGYGVLVYKPQTDALNTKVVSDSPSSFLLSNESSSFSVQLECSDNEIQELSNLNVVSNASEVNFSTIKLKTECLFPIELNLENNLVGPGEEVAYVDWSKNGNKIATSDGTIRIWDATTGEFIREIIDLWPFNDVSWNPDGTKLVTSLGNQIIIFDTTTGASLLTINNTHEDEVTSLVWSSDGTRIASASTDFVKIHNASDGKVLRAFAANEESSLIISDLALSSDGAQVAYIDGYATVRDIESRAILLRERGTSFVSFNPQANQIAFKEDSFRQPNTSIIVKDVSTNTELFQSSVPYMHDLEWSPDGKWIANTSYTEDEIILQIRNASTGFLKTQYLLTPRDFGLSTNDFILSWHPNSKQILVFFADGTGKLFNLDTEEYDMMLGGVSGTFTSLNYSDNGKLLTSSESSSGSSYKWMSPQLNLIASSTVAARFTESHWIETSQDISAFMTVPCSLGSDCPRLKMFDGQTGKEMNSVELPMGGSYRFSWSPDGTKFAFAQNEKDIIIFDTISSKELLRLQDSRVTFQGYLAWSPDGKLIVTTQSRNLIFWNTEDGSITKTLVDSGAYGMLKWSPTEQQLKGDYNIINVETGEQILDLRDSEIGGLAQWSHDGKRLFSSIENVLTVTSSFTGRILLEIPIATLSTSFRALLTISKDGSLLAVGYPENLYIWEINYLK